MEIEPVLMIWSSGCGTLEVETDPPLAGLAPSWSAGAAVAAADAAVYGPPPWRSLAAGAMLGAAFWYS